jgi:RNA polymerase sigma-70 factor (ECF subfamily)
MQNEPDAEKITQDVFTSIFRNVVKFEGDAAVSTWVYRITVNTALKKSATTGGFLSQS